MSIKFYPIASGSNGNSTYIGTKENNMLVDVGVSCRYIENRLSNVYIDPKKIDFILITHEHRDHILGAGVVSRKYDIPIYATEKTWNYIECRNMIGYIKQYNKKYIYENERLIINDIIIKSFSIPHDAADPVGYSIYYEGRKVSILTDLGHITDCIKEKVYNSDILLLESNHDIEMLLKGRYPYNIKERILGNYGHLSNESAGNFLMEIMCDKLKYVFLGHLSGENNNSDIAFGTVKRILETRKGYYENIDLFVANKNSIKDVLILD